MRNIASRCSGDTGEHRACGVRVWVALVVASSFLGVEHAVRRKHTTYFARRQPLQGVVVSVGELCFADVLWVLDASSTAVTVSLPFQIVIAATCATYLGKCKCAQPDSASLSLEDDAIEPNKPTWR